MRHDIIVHESPDPRTFGVECSCGMRAMAFFGRENVEKIIDDHYAENGVIEKVHFL